MVTLSPNPIPWLQHPGVGLGVLTTEDFCEGCPSASLSCHQGVKMPPLQELGWGRRWEQNPEVQQPNPSLSKFIHCWGSVPPCSWYMQVFLCLCKCSPCSLLSSSLSLTFLVHLSKRHPFLKAHSKCYFFHVAFPSLMWFLLPLNPTVVYTFLMTASSPGCLSWNAHSEMMGPNSL